MVRAGRRMEGCGHENVPKSCTPTNVLQSSTRVSPKRCPARVSHKSVLQECPTRVSDKSALQECLTRVSYKSVPQAARVDHRSVLQKLQLVAKM